MKLYAQAISYPWQSFHREPFSLFLQLFTTFSSFYNRNKNPTIRTAIIPSGNVSDASDESETDSENLSDFESNEESDSDVRVKQRKKL